MGISVFLNMVLIFFAGCEGEPSNFDTYEHATFLELIERAGEFDGSKVCVEGLLSSNTAATILDPTEKPFTFDELGVPWISIEDPNWEFRQPMVPRLVRIYGDYQKYSLDYPTLGRFTKIRYIEMIGIKDEFRHPHQREWTDPEDPFR